MVRTELGWLLSHPHHGWLICISRNWDCTILKNYNWVIFLQCSHDKNSTVKYCVSFLCSHNNVFITFVIAMLCMVLGCKILVRVITRLTTNWGQNILMSGNRFLLEQLALTHYGLVTPYGDRSGSTLAQVMAWCLTAPSHYLNQCWLIINEVHWHSY